MTCWHVSRRRSQPDPQGCCVCVCVRAQVHGKSATATGTLPQLSDWLPLAHRFVVTPHHQRVCPSPWRVGGAAGQGRKQYGVVKYKIYLISRGMKSMFSDDSAYTCTHRTVPTVPTVPYHRTHRTVYPLYPLYRTQLTHCTVPTVPTVPYPPYLPYRTDCTHRTVPPYPTYHTLHRTIIFEDRTPPQSITLEIW